MAELGVLDGDIVCLQEVGVEYEPVLARDLEKQGYKGEYCQHVGQGDGQGESGWVIFLYNKFGAGTFDEVLIFADKWVDWIGLAIMILN